MEKEVDEQRREDHKTQSEQRCQNKCANSNTASDLLKHYSNISLINL